MFRNALASALRGLRRDWANGAINIGGLTLGLAVAILIGLFIRDELSYDRFLPGHERLYRLSLDIPISGQKGINIPYVPVAAGRFMPLDFPELEAVTRLDREVYGVRRGDVDVSEAVLAADPNFLALFKFPLLAGDPETALATPDSVVMTERMALKYFGRPDPIGETIEIGHGHPMRVTAVLRDPPSNTHFDLGLLVSGRADFTAFAKADADTDHSQSYFETYVRLRSGVDPAAVSARFDDFVRRRISTDDQPNKPVLSMRNIASIHLHPAGLGETKPGGDVGTLWALAIVAGLILLAASVNFINLQTARSTRRAVEVGVRKLSGASRPQLFTQFMAETVASAVLALILAVCLVELALPQMNGFLGRTIAFAYWREPVTLAALVVLALAVGLGAGAYPALILSSYRPVAALKAGRLSGGSGRLRQGLVVLQFAVSIGLVIATAIIHRQTEFARGESLRDYAHPILLISNLRAPFPAASFDTLRDRLGAVPGVRKIAASSVVPTDFSKSATTVDRPGHESETPLTIDTIAVDRHFLDLYGLEPLAGQSFAPDRRVEAGDPIVLTETAVRFLGFPNDEAAVGEDIVIGRGGGNPDPNPPPSRIIGVVPNFITKSVRDTPEPTVFVLDDRQVEFLSLELDGADLPATVASIDRVWREISPEQPIRRTFLDERVAALYLDMARESQIFTVFAALAIVIGGLGLYGLAGFTAERRTKEIGIRKALGASTTDVLLLMMWQFLQPVLIANALAWPVAWFAMRRWLDGFPLRIELPVEPFLWAGAAALAVAILTTGMRVLTVARAHPVAALRYE